MLHLACVERSQSSGACAEARSSALTAFYFVPAGAPQPTARGAADVPVKQIGSVTNVLLGLLAF